MQDLKQRFSIRIAAPQYSELSGGVRALYLLCHHLNKLGFRASILLAGTTVGETGAPAYLDVPVERDRAPRDRNDAGSITVYTEIWPGNADNARYVVRFLLNRPGAVGDDRVSTFGNDDFFITFDKAHVPRGRRYFDLFVPLVDRRFYYQPREEPARTGFVLCSKRRPERPIVVPPWAQPLTLAVAHRLRSHQELGELYRRARGLIAYERSTAIYEALCCGCPVVCIASEHFNEETYQPRFGGAGMTWQASETAILEAQADVPRFKARYDEIERDFPARLEEVFLAIFAEAAARG